MPIFGDKIKCENLHIPSDFLRLAKVVQDAYIGAKEWVLGEIWYELVAG
jgi:hypothetical protein